MVGRNVAQHVEHDQRNNCQHDDQDSSKHSTMSTRAINGKVIGTFIVVRYFPDVLSSRFLVPDLLPHLEQNYGADQRILDGAGKEEWRCILDQTAHDVRATAFDDDLCCRCSTYDGVPIGNGIVYPNCCK